MSREIVVSASQSILLGDCDIAMGGSQGMVTIFERCRVAGPHQHESL